MTTCAYDVDCADVLDLTDPGTLAAAGTSQAELACAWEDLADLGGTPPTWTLAGRLVAGGLAGVVVPSFAKSAAEADVNAVFWRWARVLPHQVRVVDDHGRLPKDDRSWR